MKSGISMLRRDQAYDTGLVKTKTTSMFFDKIWVPSSLMDDPYIGENFGYQQIPKIVRIDENLVINHSRYYKLSREFPSLFGRNSLPSRSEIIKCTRSFLYSTNRNGGIFRIVGFFRAIFEMDITPVYFSQTQYEAEHETFKWLGKNLEHYMRIKPTHVVSKLQKGKANWIAPPPISKFDSIAFCIEGIPEIIEEKLKWAQVLELRNDKNEQKKLRRFRNWMIGLNDKTGSEIQDIIGQSIDDYKFALRKHGVLATTGALTTVVSVATSIEGISSGNAIETLTAGLAIATGITVFTINEAINFAECRRAPVAFIYDVLNSKV